VRRSLRPVAIAVALLMATVAFQAAMPEASAQDIDQIVQELEDNGYYIEAGADGSNSSFADLARQSQTANDVWYFVSLTDDVADTFANDVFDAIAPRGNVLVLHFDGPDYVVQLASDETSAVEQRALAPFDGDWEQPAEFMAEVVAEFDRLAVSSTAGNSGSSSESSASTGSSSSGGGGFPWLLIGIPAVVGGGLWFMSRSGKKKKSAQDLGNAQKIRAELQTELDELANDVLVLSGPVDLSENTEVVTYYREAADAYLDISDEVPDAQKLEGADLRELAEFGTRVAHARWQMDAAEALMDGEPVPEKPNVPPPPAPKVDTKTQQRRAEQRQRMPQRQARPRVPYSQSRRRSGGGLLDILIAGSGMLGGRSRGGGMFGGSQRNRRSSGGMFGGGSSRQSQPQRRSGGGVFGGSSRSRTSNSRSRTSPRRTPSRSSSRSRSRTPRTSRPSTSRRRRRR